MSEHNREGVVVEGTESSEMNGLQRPRAAKATMAYKNCRYGARCRYKNSSCPFLHPPLLTNDNYSINVPTDSCREVKNVNLDDCRVKVGEHVSVSIGAVAPAQPQHVFCEDVDGERAAPTGTPVVPLIPETPMHRKRCKFGARCYRKGCKFLHPPRTVANPQVTTSAPKLQTAVESLRQTPSEKSQDFQFCSDGLENLQQQPIMYAADLEQNLMERAQAQGSFNKPLQQVVETGDYQNKVAATAASQTTDLNGFPGQKNMKNQKHRRKTRENEKQGHGGTSQVAGSRYVESDNPRVMTRKSSKGNNEATHSDSKSYEQPNLHADMTGNHSKASAFKTAGRHAVTKQTVVLQPTVVGASALPPSPSPTSPPVLESSIAKDVGLVANAKDAAGSLPSEGKITKTAKPIKLRDKSDKQLANSQLEPERSSNRNDYANNNGSHTTEPPSSEGDAVTVPATSPKATPPEESEAEKKRRRLEEMRRQQAMAALKTKQKKTNRHQRYLQELEEATEKRRQFWVKEIEKEERISDMIAELCVAEFCRSLTLPMDLDRQTILDQSEMRDELKILCQEAYRTLYEDDIASRIVVKDSKQQDLNGRTGAIEFWDRSKRKFYVRLETKKGKGVLVIHLPPENLESVVNPANRKKKQYNAVFPIYIESFYNGNDLTVDVDKEMVDDMLKADSLDTFLEYFIKSRNRDDAEAKRLAEERKREEEIERRRRAEKRRQEAEQWEQRQREWAEQKERLKEMRREHMKWQRSQYRGGQHSSSDCNCDRCRLERDFVRHFVEGMFFGRGRGGRASAFFVNPNFFSHGDDSDDDESYEDEWDQEWNHLHDDDIASKNEEAAAILGVSLDATVAEIKRAYRTKARLYHPDSYRPEHHEDGLTKGEAEEHFKKLVDAYDHLLSNFDD